MLVFTQIVTYHGMSEGSNSAYAELGTNDHDSAHFRELVHSQFSFENSNI